MTETPDHAESSSAFSTLRKFGISCVPVLASLAGVTALAYAVDRLAKRPSAYPEPECGWCRSHLELSDRCGSCISESNKKPQPDRSTWTSHPYLQKHSGSSSTPPNTHFRSANGYRTTTADSGKPSTIFTGTPQSRAWQYDARYRASAPGPPTPRPPPSPSPTGAPRKWGRPSTRASAANRRSPDPVEWEHNGLKYSTELLWADSREINHRLDLSKRTDSFRTTEEYNKEKDMLDKMLKGSLACMTVLLNRHKGSSSVAIDRESQWYGLKHATVLNETERTRSQQRLRSDGESDEIERLLEGAKFVAEWIDSERKALGWSWADLRGSEPPSTASGPGTFR